MPKLPPVKDTRLVIYETRASHHHHNDEEDLPDTEFSILFNVQPDRLGLRLKIDDEYRDGTVSVDVAVLYYWQHDASPDDDLDSFVEQVAIPQILACASTVLLQTSREIIIRDRIQFHGLSALDVIVDKFRSQKRSLSEILVKNMGRRLADKGEKDPD